MKATQLIKALQEDIAAYGDEDLFVLVWGRKAFGHSLETSWDLDRATWSRVVDAAEQSGDVEVGKRSIREDLVALVKKAINK